MSKKNQASAKQNAPSALPKKHGKQDQKLVAFSQSDHEEVKYIAKHYKIPIAVVRKVMAELGKNGKPCRSRAKIYAALRLLGYPIPTRNKSK